MKPTLLFITGWAHGTESVQPIAYVLAADYHVKTLSGAQVLEDRIIPEVDYIVTSSMGGLLAMEFLPEQCKKLVLISSTAKFCADEDYTCGTPEKILRRMIPQLKCSPDTVLEEFSDNMHSPNKKGRRSILSNCGSLESLVMGLEYLLSADVRDKVPKIKIPVLLMHGTEDRIIPHTAAEWLHAQLPDSQLEIFENGGHALPSHHFAQVMNKLVRFLSNR